MPDKILEKSPAPPRPPAVARACTGRLLEFSTCFSDAPADHSTEVLAVAPSLDPCLVGDTISLDDASFTTKIAIHSGAGVLAPFGCVALLDTGSPQTFIRQDVLDRMLTVGAASIACEEKCAPRSWGGFGESTPLKTSTRVRLSVQFFRENEPTCSLAVWACAVPPSVMQHAALLGRESWMRFNSRSYRSLPPHPDRYVRVRHRPRRFGWRLPFIYATRALQASPCPTIPNCLLPTWFATMVSRHSLDTTWST